VIDTPGLRQVGLSDETDFDSGFSDIAELSQACRFSDCRHASEPNCAVKRALENGSLSADRWASYQKLQRELAFEQRKKSPALQAEEKKRWAKIAVANRVRERQRR
jgi:ribosome biogenesis GTPase